MTGVGQPDVTFSEQVLPGQFPWIASAVPLFIGYTQQGTAYSLVSVDGFSDFETAFGGPSTGEGILYYAMKHYFDNGGTGAFVLSLGSYSALESISAADLISAFSDARITQAIAEEGSITLAAIPDMTLLSDSDSGSWAKAWSALLAICLTRPGVFGIFDAPDAPDAASACLSAFTSLHPPHPEWAAAYWPRLVTTYGADDASPVIVPPSAAVAAVIVCTDAQSGVWKAPANVALSRVVKPTQSWLQSADLFHPDSASFNLIRSFAGRGTRVWGCRTLTADETSPWLYVQIRRFIGYIEAQLSQIGRDFVFDDNNSLTWLKLKGIAHIWLRRLWQSGGLYGETEEEAFYIQIVLDETMTEEDVLNGKMILEIGVAVAFPAEFISISLTFDARLAYADVLESDSTGGL
jgi:hypothetical protein